MPRKTGHLQRRLRAVLLAASMRPRPDAAENPDGIPHVGDHPGRFNEAAARCRGKPAIRPQLSSFGTPASMRPRPDAAENHTIFVRDAAGAGAASMRPRPDAAENLRERRQHLFPAAGASMRPRPDAAENRMPGRAAEGRGRRFNEAAARCRGKPSPCSTGSSECGCFNEAAARCRGKPRGGRRHVRHPNHRASMRPRPDAAENRPPQESAA